MDELICSEATIEQWVCDHKDTLFPGYPVLIGRQIELPHSGRLDVLVATPPDEQNDYVTTLWVVEVKRDSIDPAAVAQCMRYMGDIAETYRLRQPNLEVVSPDGLWLLASGMVGVKGVLVAPSMTPEAAMMLRAFRDQLRFIFVRAQINGHMWHPGSWGFADETLRGRSRDSHVVALVEKEIQREEAAYQATIAVMSARAAGKT